MTVFQKLIVMLLKNLVCDVHAIAMTKCGYNFTEVYFEKWEELSEEEMLIAQNEDDLK